MTASPTDDLASAERRIQELTKELSQARGALAEGREQQAATAGILAALSSSPADLRRVCDEIAANAARLCDAYDATIFQVDGGFLHIVAHHGAIPQSSTLPIIRGFITGRVVLERQTIQVADIQVQTDEYPEGSARARDLGHRTILAVPLIHDGEAIGAIAIRRTAIRPFTDRQIELLKTFADQAVIAIESTRLFEEVQARTRELTEALEQQTATSDVLAVIASSPGELEPVFQSLLANAVRICEASFGAMWLREGDSFRNVTFHGALSPVYADQWRGSVIRPDSDMPVARAARSRKTIHIEDLREDPTYLGGKPLTVSAVDTGGIRTMLAVPMFKEDEFIGAMAIYRLEVRPFSDKQIELIKSFATQAVIAIENTRLLSELRESLQQQTATADVLKVISRSALDVQKVLDALVESAARLCDAYDAAIFQVFGNSMRLVAHHGQIPTIGPVGQLTIPLERGSIGARAVIERRTIHVADMLAEADEYPESRERALRLGYRTALAVPLVHAGEAIGNILIRRAEVRPFTERQIELVDTFADQAVIAIENTRLLEAEQDRTKQLMESLEQQTATSELLKVIGRSTFDLQPVFEALADSAVRLCEAERSLIYRLDGDRLRVAASHNATAEVLAFLERNPMPLARASAAGRASVERRTIQIEDVLADPEYTYGATQVDPVRTVLAIPMLRGDELLGVIVIYRHEVLPFTTSQIALMETFADQAVIAIENTRLFEEVQARTRELAKTVEDLEIASQHKSQFVANMSHELRTPLAAILGYAELIQEGFYEPQGPKSLDALTRISSNGKHLLGLINTVLDIAKIESGQFTLNMTEYAIESVVETVRAATESLAHNKKLTLTTTVAKSLPMGLGDEQRLTQVLLNLVGNAIKFTDAGEVSIAAGARTGNFAVSVRDTGPGIPLDQQDRIFEQFHQVDSSMTKAKGGTGLGLAIAKQIVEMHGGRIWVVSTPGKGSTFQMELPTRAEFRKPGGEA